VKILHAEVIELLKMYESDRKVVLCVNEGDHEAVGKAISARPSVINDDLLFLEAVSKDKSWGRAAWSDVDIKEALKERKIKPTKGLIEAIKDTWAYRHIAEAYCYRVHESETVGQRFFCRWLKEYEEWK
jgi:hypothetical protein